MNQEPPHNDRGSIITPERLGKKVRDINAVKPEDEYHSDLETLEREIGGVREVSYARSYGWPLDFYFRRQYITGSQHRAGCDYHQIWRTGVIHAGHTQTKYDVRHGSNGKPEDALRTELEYQDAFCAIRGHEQQKVAYIVCCMGEYSGRGNMRLLRDALTDLYEHFKKLRDGQYVVRNDHK